MVFLFRSFKEKGKKEQKKTLLFTFICPCCTMAESSEYNLFYFESRMQYLWPTGGGYFVNVDFDVLGHPRIRGKGIQTLLVEQILQ